MMLKSQQRSILLSIFIIIFYFFKLTSCQIEDPVSTAIQYIEQENKVSLGFQILHNFILSNEKSGTKIKSEIYGRYAEAFYLLGNRGIPKDIEIDENRIINACEIFLNGFKRSHNKHYKMLALQTYGNVLHAIGKLEKGAEFLNELHHGYIHQSGFVCPEHKHIEDAEISKIVTKVANGIPSTNNLYHGKDVGTVDVWHTDDLTADEFKKSYLIPRRLVKIAGVTKGWNAIQSWSWNNLPITFRDVPNFSSWVHSKNCIQSFIMSDFFYHCPKNTYEDYRDPIYFEFVNDISYAFGLRLKASYTDFMVFSHRGGGAGFHKDAYDQSFWNM